MWLMVIQWNFSFVFMELILTRRFFMELSLTLRFMELNFNSRSSKHIQLKTGNYQLQISECCYYHQ